MAGLCWMYSNPKNLLLSQRDLGKRLDRASPHHELRVLLSEHAMVGGIFVEAEMICELKCFAKRHVLVPDFDDGGFAPETHGEDVESAHVDIRFGPNGDAVAGLVVSLAEFAADGLLVQEKLNPLGAFDRIENGGGEIGVATDDFSIFGHQIEGRVEEDVILIGVIDHVISHVPVSGRAGIAGHLYDDSLGLAVGEG